MIHAAYGGAACPGTGGPAAPLLPSPGPPQSRFTALTVANLSGGAHLDQTWHRRPRAGQGQRRNHPCARQWTAEHHGSLAAPVRASIGGYPIGTWLSALRAQAQVPAGEAGALDPDRRAALEAIDAWWAPSWPVEWQRTYAAARAWWLACEGRVEWPALPAETEFEGEAIGRWVAAQRGAWAQLEEEQRELLAALGIAEDQVLAEQAAEKAAAKERPATSRADRFGQHLAALVRFAAREGHVRVPRQHKEPGDSPDGAESGEPVLLGLGAWLNNTKSRRAKLAPEQLAALAEVGVEWA
ncbi:helicase associated domain-containing protein [Kitasatospora cineracea]|uniref:helicase associated domain-containing protein n=1 Tax=Kitasatospora cineracea TaxID=88074 RepID=UPI003F4CE0DE